MKSDILFKTEDAVFSYRVGGILIRDGKVLLQKPENDGGYAIPGGHAVFGETSKEALVREFREEIGADIQVDRLLLVGENFFPWGKRPCHQICFYYAVSLLNPRQIPLDGVFKAQDELGGERIDLDFCWIELQKLKDILLYPQEIAEKILHLPQHIEHLVFHQRNDG